MSKPPSKGSGSVQSSPWQRDLLETAQAKNILQVNFSVLPTEIAEDLIYAFKDKAQLGELVYATKYVRATRKLNQLITQLKQKAANSATKEEKKDEDSTTGSS